MDYISELFKNEEFCKALAEVRSAEDIQKLYSTFGLELEEGMTWEKLFEEFKKGVKEGAESSEFSEEELEAVAGGGKWYDHYCEGYYAGFDGKTNNKCCLTYKAGYKVGKFMGKIFN